MSIHRKGQGSIALQITELDGQHPVRHPKQPSSPVKPTTLFKRSDTPFTGGGTEVQLVAEPGYTKTGWLSVPFRLQCPPLDSWQRTAAHDWQSYSVTGGTSGPHERSRSGGPKLRTVSFKTVFLDWEPEWQVWSPDELDPLLAVAELEALCLDGIKFRLRIRNSEMYAHDDVNYIAVITQAEATEEAGEPDARYLNLAFQEWRATEIERMSVKNQQGPWTHKIKPQDNLYTVAKFYYHDQTLWQVIANANPGMQHQPPSGDLIVWGRHHHKSSIRVPSKPSTTKRIAAAAGTGGIEIPGL